MRRTRVVTSAAIAVCAIAGWAACGIYDASLLLPADAGARDDVLSPAPSASASSSTDANTCNHAHWPARPSMDDPDAGTAPSGSVVMALSSLSFGASDAGPPPLYGFDLDSVCTCPGPDSCKNALSPSPHCDEDGGRDNAGGALLQLVSAFPGLSSSALDQSLASGRFGFLVQLTGWNGRPNDTLVTAAVYVSNGLSGFEDGGAGPAKGDGTDRWTISPDSLHGGATLDGVDCGGDNAACSPLYVDDNAYVSGGTLVGSLDFPISIGSATAGTVSLDLTGSVIAAPLVQVSGGWAIQNGVIDGRWAAGELLSSLSALKDPVSANGAYLCGTDSTYQFAKTEICNAMDIAADPALDQTGAPCDAVSLAVGFTANPALMAEVVPKAEPAEGCVSDAGTPFHDSCN